MDCLKLQYASRGRDSAGTFAPARRARGYGNGKAARSPSLAASVPAAALPAALPPPRSGPRVAIVTTLRAVPDSMLRGFVRWHLQLGFCRLYLYFDDPADPGIRVAKQLRREAVAAGAPGGCVRIVPCDARLRDSWSELSTWQRHAGREGKMVEVRQMLNAEHALRSAYQEVRKRGPLQ